MSGETVRISIAVEGPSDAALLAWAIRHAEANGYAVTSPHERWELAGEFCARLGVHSNTLTRATKHPRRPNVLVKRGPSGARIAELLSNAEFDAFVLRYKNRKAVSGEGTTTPGATR